MPKFKHHEWVVLSLLIIFLGIFLMFSQKEAGEIDKILVLKNTSEQSTELLKLLDRVGVVEAQEKLVSSSLPFTGETHLLVHTIGDYTYNQYGLSGLSLCRDYFLSACYHGFIINTLADHGIEGMIEAMEECGRQAPGVASQCAHAAGHGFVVWHNYDLVKGAEMCDKLGAEVTDFAYFNCYDGVFMENVWGVHNGTPSKDRWVSDTDIYYPCTDTRIPEKYLGGCWSNQATLIYQHYKGDLRKTALACDAVENKDYRDICYNNLARQIHPMTEGRKEKVFSLCGVATGIERQNECILTNMIAYWSVGDRKIPYEICATAPELLKEECYRRLVGMIEYHYKKLPEEKDFYCDKIPNEILRNSCKN